MKRAELIRHLEKHGCVFLKEGGRHTIYYDPVSNRTSSVPRHTEINTFTGKKICRDLGVVEIRKK